MKLNKICNDTYYVDSLINIGVYLINKKECVLLDVGLYGHSYDEFIALISKLGLKPIAIILTHCHSDHVLGVNELVKEYGCKIYAPKIECDFIENPDLTGLFVYPSYPFDDMLKARHHSTAYDFVYDLEDIVVADKVFKPVNLSGHSPNMKGIVTPDNVLYSSDAYVGADYLRKAKLLYAYNLRKTFEIYEYLKTSKDYNYFIPSHGLPKKDISDDIASNLNYYDTMIKLLLEFLIRPKGMDDIMGYFISTKQVNINIPSYLITKGCLTSVLVYLESKDMLDIIFESGVMKYTKSSIS